MLENWEASEDRLYQPPPTLDNARFLEDMKDMSVLSDSEYSIKRNEVVNSALAFLPKTVLFIKILWRKICHLLKCHVKSNLADTTLTMSFLKDVTAKVWFLSCDANVRSLLLLVLWGENKRGSLEESEISFCSDLALKIYEDILNQISCCVRESMEAATVSNLRVSDMDTVGLSKVRYLGGYVAHVLIKRASGYVSENMHSHCKQVGTRVEHEMKKINRADSTENMVCYMSQMHFFNI